ncbi:chorismate--pyruvate lyase family protein [Thalassotalea euphylliae]|uniref:chorismate--pyruvate lyase family protein n=1 Tax=Thalassotalea euphylliae TaxID=1655234 RepID=UPI0036DDF3C5
MQSISQFFPVTLPAIWRHLSPSSFNNVMGSWLFDSSSLTARLKANCQKFHVEVIGQKEEIVQTQDACEHITQGTKAIIREVLLYCDGQPHVFARSIMPLDSLTDDEAFLANLGDKPLGQAIFNSPHLTRGDFSVAQFDSDTRVVKLSNTITDINVEALWGRRSIFFLHDKPLAVAEVFLPSAIAYQEEMAV